MTANKNMTPRPLVKMATGILGFDEVSRGGLPRSRTSLVMGGPGTGKTVFALQTLANAARERKQPGIFVAFEEGPDEIRANAAPFGWGVPAMAKSVRFFLDARLSPTVVQSGDFDLS
ncbi:MAG TPA: ATPase domain-containing protein, partial [Steroidobacteraceae bacterium]